MKNNESEIDVCGALAGLILFTIIMIPETILIGYAILLFVVTPYIAGGIMADIKKLFGYK